MPNVQIDVEGLSDNQVEMLIHIADLMRSMSTMKQVQARKEFGRLWAEWKKVAPAMDEDEVQALVEDAIADVRAKKG